MRRILTILVVAVMAVSSVCGACAAPFEMPATSKAQTAEITNNTSINDTDDIKCGDEWTIEISQASIEDSDERDTDTDFVEVVNFQEESSDNDEWTIQI